MLLVEMLLPLVRPSALLPSLTLFLLLPPGLSSSKLIHADKEPDPLISRIRDQVSETDEALVGQLPLQLSFRRVHNEYAESQAKRKII